MNYQAFTLKHDHQRLSVLKTQVGVTVAFDPTDSPPHPIPQPFVGIWDTGATNSVISKNVVDKLGLIPFTKVKSYHANGESIVDCYLVNLVLPNGVGIQAVKVTEGILKGTDVLIGMDVITLGDFSITNFGGKTTFSFRIPSVEEVDFVAHGSPHIPNVNPHKKIQRNDPCPCKSGKKYKNCCGKGG